MCIGVRLNLKLPRQSIGTRGWNASQRAPLSPAKPDLWALHHHTEADWQRILAGHPEQAEGWIRFAAERGFKAAQVVLGQMHLDGRGTTRDANAAYDWFARAARIGNVEARNLLGRCSEYGWGTPVDHATALEHYVHAAATGYGWASYNIGCLRLYGDVPRDHAEAFSRFTNAAAGGDPAARAKALDMLGRCHEEGWGTPVDALAARRCYRAASEAGDCWGALNLGLLLLEAVGLASALPQLERALTLASPDCRLAVARALAVHREAAVASLGQGAVADLGPMYDERRSDRPVEADCNRHGVASVVFDFRTVIFLSAALLGAIVMRRIRRKCRP